MTILRSALFNLVFFGISFVLTLMAAVSALVSPTYILPVAMLWARLLRGALRIICGIKVDVTGLEHIRPGPALIASRHQSAFDTFVWLTLLPRCCYVLKQELLGIPVFGRMLLGSGMIAIDRQAGANAIRTLFREADRAMREGRQIVIFPEGTRSEPGKPQALQSGILALASRTGLPIIPVATDSGLYWGRRSFRKRPGTIRVLIAPPIEPSADRKQMLRALERGISALDQPNRPVADATE